MSSPPEPLPVRCPGEKWCPITATATLVQKKWHVVIVHRLLTNGPLGFNALEDAVDGISSKVLSESLDDLEAKSLVERTVISEKPFRVEYALTRRGTSLEPVVDSMFEWGREYLAPVDGDATTP